MKTILCFMVFGTLITRANLDTDDKPAATDINEEVQIRKCRGNDAEVGYTFDIKEDQIRRVRFYYKDKVIYPNNFTQNTSDQDRIEKTNITWIKLKNVSHDDEGKYIIQLATKVSYQMWNKTVNLHILEPPTDSCTCKMLLTSNFTSEPTASYCGRPTVSPDWKKKKSDVSGDGNRIMNTTMQEEEILCCLHGEAMKCVNDPEKFCDTVRFKQDYSRPSDDGKTQHIDLVTVPETRKESSTTLSETRKESSTTLPETRKESSTTLSGATIGVIIGGIIGGIIIIVIPVIICFYCREKKKKGKYVVDPRPETGKLPTNHPVTESESGIELQKLLDTSLVSNLRTEGENTVNQRMNSDAIIDIHERR